MLSVDDAWENFLNNTPVNTTDHEEKEQNEVPENEDIPKCSDLYISTTTKISYFDKNVDLFTTFWKIPIISYSSQCSGCVKNR